MMRSNQGLLPSNLCTKFGILLLCAEIGIWLGDFVTGPVRLIMLIGPKLLPQVAMSHGCYLNLQRSHFWVSPYLARL